MFDDASLIEYSKRMNIEIVISKLQKIENYRTVLPDQWNILVDLYWRLNRKIESFDDLENFWAKVKEYEKSGYQMNPALVRKLDEVIQNTNF